MNSHQFSMMNLDATVMQVACPSDRRRVRKAKSFSTCAKIFDNVVPKSRAVDFAKCRLGDPQVSSCGRLGRIEI